MATLQFVALCYLKNGHGKKHTENTEKIKECIPCSPCKFPWLVLFTLDDLLKLGNAWDIPYF